jgi:hypothetical protein
MRGTLSPPQRESRVSTNGLPPTLEGGAGGWELGEARQGSPRLARVRGVWHVFHMTTIIL